MTLKKFFSRFVISISITFLLTGCSSSKWLKSQGVNLELEEIVKNHEDGMKLIRLTFIAWSRAYDRMAAGI